MPFSPVPATKLDADVEVLKGAKVAYTNALITANSAQTALDQATGALTIARDALNAIVATMQADIATYQVT